MLHTVIIVIAILVYHASSLMIKPDCPYNEIYKSCAFSEEYTCWESEDLSKRVLSLPDRLTHCKSGCYCKKGYVRAYPESSCIMAVYCRDRDLQIVMNKLPDMVIDF